MNHHVSKGDGVVDNRKVTFLSGQLIQVSWLSISQRVAAGRECRLSQGIHSIVTEEVLVLPTC